MSTYQELLMEWFGNQDWWFSSTPDIDSYLAEKYFHLIDINVMAHNPLSNSTNTLGCILVYDQISRHALRGQPAAHIVSYYNLKAMSLSYSILDHFEDFLELLNNPQWCFVLLPLRHTKDPRHIFVATKYAWKLLQVNKERSYDTSEQLKKFLIASYQRCPMDQCERIQLYYPDPNMFIDSTSFETVLDHKTHNRINLSIENPNIEMSFIHCTSYLHDRNIRNIIVSLSGGVDSMVCLHYLIKEKHMHNLNIFAVHINYCNRDNSMAEEMFVQAWCNNMNIPLVIRRIKEINRPQCMEFGLRSLYESYTKDVRYSTYKSASKAFNIDNSYGVVLGHNKTDCLENILTNIAYRTKYENLLGMDSVSHYDNIVLLRPLLEVEKDIVISFAEQCNIPYVHNSTPKWSQRGKIRNDVVPILDQWDQRLIPGIFEVSKLLSETYSMVKSMSSLMKSVYTVSINANEWYLDMKRTEIPKSDVLWKEYFNNVNIKCSKKSLENFCTRLNRVFSNTHGHHDKSCIILSKKTRIILETNVESVKVHIYIL